MPNNQIRIIAGQWRGRKITFSEAEGLRPTSDRIRETLFNWLAPFIECSQCLDLFAGSGSLGLEALSRGAMGVTFIDRNRHTVQGLQKALESLPPSQATVLLADAFEFIKKESISHFDIFFIDPHYAEFNLQDIASHLEQKLKTKSCRIYYESYQSINESELFPNWKIEKQKKAGKVFFYLIKRIAV